MSKFQAAVFNPSTEVETNLLSLIDNAASNIVSQYPKLAINIDNREETHVLGSRLLHVVFDNLFRNSVFHAGETTQIEISTQNRHVQILYSDNGPGISEEIKNTLFHRGVSTKGTGLGLYISREILKSIGGTIELADSINSQGGTFRITIPIVE